MAPIHLSSDIVRLSLCLAALGVVYVARFFVRYLQARRQFPGPPVTNIWSGNLTELMTDTVHEKWRQWHREHGPVYQTVSSFSVSLGHGSHAELRSGTACSPASSTSGTRN